jgi:hypothetical protein
MSQITKEELGLIIKDCILGNKKGIVIAGAGNNMLAEVAKEMMNEQIAFYNTLCSPEESLWEIMDKIEILQPEAKEEKPKDWYRKFDNKKRWQK